MNHYCINLAYLINCFSGWLAVKKPVLRKVNREKKPKCAKLHNWSQNQWQQVFWSDEIQRSETMSLHPPVKHGEGSVKTDGIIKYKHILIYHVILSETLLIGFISQQENDPEHPANAVKAHMARKST